MTAPTAAPPAPRPDGRPRPVSSSGATSARVIASSAGTLPLVSGKALSTRTRDWSTVAGPVKDRRRPSQTRMARPATGANPAMTPPGPAVARAVFQASAEPTSRSGALARATPRAMAPITTSRIEPISRNRPSTIRQPPSSRHSSRPQRRPFRPGLRPNARRNRAPWAMTSAASSASRRTPGGREPAARVRTMAASSAAQHALIDAPRSDTPARKAPPTLADPSVIQSIPLHARRRVVASPCNLWLPRGSGEVSRGRNRISIQAVSRPLGLGRNRLAQRAIGRRPWRAEDGQHQGRQHHPSKADDADRRSQLADDLHRRLAD
jgi:hypothetical protein